MTTIAAVLDDTERVHCANCRHARVASHPKGPVATCECGHGKPMKVSMMTRSHCPGQFQRADKCKDFEAAE